jgi:hypothetical protein
MPKLTAENSTAMRKTIEMLGSGAKAENTRPASTVAATAAVDHRKDIDRREISFCSQRPPQPFPLDAKMRRSRLFKSRFRRS